MNLQNISKKGITLATIAGSLVIGGLGGTLLSAVAIQAQTPTTAPVVVTQSPGTSNSVAKFKSNEDATHEAKENPEKETLEDHGRINHYEDPAKEVNEVPGQETKDDVEQ